MGEPAGFREYVVARRSALLSAAWLLTGETRAAEDLVQEALSRVWPRWARVVACGDPHAYVRQTLVRTYASGRRRRWHGERPVAQVPERVTEDAFGPADDRADVAVLLGVLSPGQRAVLVLRYLEDCTEEQTAAALGCAVGTVKSQHAKALARLRAHLSERTAQDV